MYTHGCTHSIGKGTGYKLSELTGLVEGSTLVIGGKQIEVHCVCVCMRACVRACISCAQ